MKKKKPTIPARGVYKGKETPAEERAEAGMPMGYKNGGMIAPNTSSGTCGPGVRSNQSQSYKKK